MRSTWFQDDPVPRRPSLSFRMPQSVVGILIIANIVVFLLQNVFGMSRTGDIFSEYLALNGGDILSGLFFLHIYEFVTYQFLHADFLHIFFNMLMLWFFGRELEKLLGSRRFLFLYLGAGVVGGVCFVILSALQGVLAPVIGASGSVFGIVIYYALMWPRKKVNVFLFPFMIPMQVMYMALFMVGADLFYGIFASGDGVAHFCHLGGALLGYLFFRYERRWEEAVAQTREWKRDRDERNEETRREEMDRLLEKIHEEGIGVLTPSERKFLNEASKRIRGRK
jgi:membrane associated rhomboid family serine protease